MHSRPRPPGRAQGRRSTSSARTSIKPLRSKARSAGGKTLAGLKQHGAVYLKAIGGAAQFYARCIDQVAGVSLMEFGTPEAMWHLQLKEFPAIVTMDAHGNSLHRDLEQASAQKLTELAVVE